MLSDIIFHKATNQPSINKICQELKNEVTRYYALLGYINDMPAIFWSFENTAQPLLEMQERIEALSSLLKALSQIRSFINESTEENITKIEELLLSLANTRSHSQVFLEVCQSSLGSTYLSPKQRSLINAALKNLAPLLRIGAPSSLNLDGLVHECDQITHKALHAKKSFLQSWIFTIHPDDFCYFDQKSLAILAKNGARLENLLQKKFGGMSSSDYAVNLDKPIADIILNFGPRTLRKRVFQGLQKSAAMQGSDSYNPQILESIVKIINLRHNIALLSGFASFSDFSEYLKPLSLSTVKLQSTYRELLPIVYQKAQQDFDLLNEFALSHDSALDFESWDLNYYLQLKEQYDCPEPPVFDLRSAIGLIREKLLTLFNLELNIIEEKLQKDSQDIIILDLVNRNTDAQVGTIQCDAFKRSGKKKRTSTEVFIIENYCVESPLTVFLCSFLEKKATQSLSFQEVLALSKNIGLAVGLLLWRSKTSNRIMLNMIPEDMQALLTLLFTSWHLDIESLTAHYPAVPASVLNTLIESYKKRETLKLLQDLQLSYFDSIIHSAAYISALNTNPEQYSPAKLWEKICENYNLEASDTIAWSISPLNQGILFGKDSLSHISIISQIYFAQVNACLKKATCTTTAGITLFDCFFGNDNPAEISEKLQANFFKESVNPEYFAITYQSRAQEDITSHPSAAIMFSSATQPISTCHHSPKK